MEKELDADVIKSTQTALGKYVKRPPLSEKLLKKPPFRFLHDIITTVLKTTGFFENLFEDQELISDNVKDRDSKISFLTKVIYVISTTTGKSLSVKPSKIISGQEPEKTNELLQCLAQALDSKLSSDNAVKQYKESINASETNTKSKEINKPSKKATDVKKLTSRSNEKLTSQKTSKNDKEKSSDVKSRRRESVSTKSEVQNKKSEQPKITVKKNTKETKNDDAERRIKTLPPNIAEKENAVKKIETERIISRVSSQDSDVSLVNDRPEKEADVDTPLTQDAGQDQLNTSYTINENDLNSSVSSSDITGTATNHDIENKPYDNNDKTEIKLVENRQHSLDDSKEIKLKNLQLATDVLDDLKDTSMDDSNELENKIIDKEKEDSFNAVIPRSTSRDETSIPRPQSVRSSSLRPSSSRPGAPRLREKVENVIKDPDNLLVGKVNIIVENAPQQEEDDSSLIILDQIETTTPSQDQQELQLSSMEHGHLVQQILESQKGLSQISGKTEIEWQFGAQKAREAVNQEIEQLRYNIQALSRVANPLGKLLDHVQEDVEVMRQELQQWSNIYEQVNKDMLQQKTMNEDSLTPFYTKLKQLGGDIEEKHDKINDLKISIHKNANRIEKLLNSGNVQY